MQYECCLLVLVALACLPCHAATSYDVFRMVQYEDTTSHNAGVFGSQRTGFSLVASTVPSQKKAVILKWNALFTADFNTIVKNSGAVLVIVSDVELAQLDMERWSELEHKLMHMNITIPVYFSRDEGLLEVYEDVLGSEKVGSWAAGLFGAELRFSVADGDSSELTSPSVSVIEGWLLADESAHAGASTLAIVAHLDTLSVAPGLSYGADANGSGAAALLELLRAFSKLYSDPRTKGLYNILFLLTTGSATGFEGASNWLKAKLAEDSNSLGSIEFVLCLDSLGRGDGMHLYTSKPQAARQIAKVYEHLLGASNTAGASFDAVHKKINISDPHTYWEHELFSKKRLAAGTLSHKANSPRMFARSHLFDTMSNVDIDVICQNVKVIGEALAKMVYNSAEEFQVFEGYAALNKDFVKAWMNALSSQSRFSARVAPGSDLLLSLEEMFNGYASRVRMHTYPGNGDIRFVVGEESKLSVQLVKPMGFHLTTLGVILVYLACIFIGIVGVTKTIEDIRGLY